MRLRYIYIYLILIVLSCTKKELATVKTNPDYIVTNNSAKIAGLITNDGGSSIVSKGICLSSKETPTIQDTIIIDTTIKLKFEAEFNGLLSNRTYFVRAFVKNKTGLNYGDIIRISTNKFYIKTVPEVVTDSVTSISTTSILAKGNVIGDGGNIVTSKGFCWGVTSNPTINNNKTTNGYDIGSFSSTIQVLIPNTTYYLRSYATNSLGTAYGNQIIFTTLNIYPPSVATNSVYNITNNSVMCNGLVSSDGGAQVVSRGFCWSSSTSFPTINNNSVVYGSGVGSFTSQITGLTFNTVYYIRAFATNSKGTQYGQVLTFKTTIGVGDSYQGGKVAYIFELGDPGYISGEIHGIIAAPTDQSSGIKWYNGTYKAIGSTSKAIGSGNTNTNLIVSSQGIGSYAAKICSDLVLGGYSDWYLPSQEELLKLYINRSIIGGFSTSDYWSSSEDTYKNAWDYGFYYYMGYSKDKQNIGAVRAIRTF
jgi:hypothetical protein